MVFRLFRSRPRPLGPFRARRIQQSLPERAFGGVETLPAAPELWDLFARAASNRAFQREGLVTLGSSGAAPELWDLFARAASNTALCTERLVAFSRAPHPTEPSVQSA